MKSNFSKRYPEFASIENHIRRAQAERAVTIANWIADAVVASVNATRGLFLRGPAKPAPARLIVKASLPR